MSMDSEIKIHLPLSVTNDVFYTASLVRHIWK